jgi:hypothetical protein
MTRSNLYREHLTEKEYTFTRTRFNFQLQRLDGQISLGRRRLFLREPPRRQPQPVHRLSGRHREPLNVRVKERSAKGCVSTILQEEHGEWPNGMLMSFSINRFLKNNPSSPL